MATGCGEGRCAVDIPQWMWGMLLMWVSITIGTGIRLYRTRHSWMRKYREDQPQRRTIRAVSALSHGVWEFRMS